jgi:hypothetical protein
MLAKHPRKSPSNTSKQLCPLALASRPATVSNVHPVVVATLAVNELDSFPFDQQIPRANGNDRSAALPPPTLLRLCCALTI